MRYLFAAFLILNFLAEAMAAVTLIGGPGGIADAGSGNQWSMHYGFAVISIATPGCGSGPGAGSWPP